MATKNRIFISFAIEDRSLRDLLVGQAKHADSPFEFVDMSVKEPWDSAWKTKCRTKIKGCDGVIAILSKNTASADGEKWEMKCATEESVPMVGIWAKKGEAVTIPAEFGKNKVIDWTWDGIAKFIDSL
ncbi:TIR domain-containing protein [bacterium]|nr:TIR domain-containing protein [bacterium]